jgi:DNA-binding CsgD family transcriptional regulator
VRELLSGRQAELDAYGRIVGLDRGLQLLSYVGEAGVGKTTLLKSLLAAAERSGTRVFDCVASQSETRLSFAGLADLLRNVSDQELSMLPTPQRRTLDLALLRIDEEPVNNSVSPDARTLGTSVVTLLSLLSKPRPVLLIIDDVQWLDSATARTLEFALRRLEGCNVTLVVSLRSDEQGDWPRISSGVSLDRVHTLPVRPMDLESLREMLGDLGFTFTGPQLRKIHRSCGGNPFYGLQIARSFGYGARPLSSALVPDRMREFVADRVNHLPLGTREQLLRASALANPTVALLDMEALAPAEEAEIIRVRSDGGVEFIHPLFAAAVHDSASDRMLRKLHAGLAKLVNGIEERATHLQLSVFRPDEAVAAILSNAARFASQRGALDAAAAFGEQAVGFTLSNEEELVFQRSLEAARYQLQAGDRVRAKALVGTVIRSTSTTLRSDALQLLAEVLVLEDMQAAILLLNDVRGLVGRDLVRSARIELILAVTKVGMMDMAGSLEHVQLALNLSERTNASGETAEALGLMSVINLMLGLGFDQASCLRALELETFDDVATDFLSRPSLMVAMAFEYSGDVVKAREILLPVRDYLLERGSESELSYVYIHLAITSDASGDFATAEMEADAALRCATWSGQELFRSFALMIRGLSRARRGDLAAGKIDLRNSHEIAIRIGWPIGVSQSTWGLGYVALCENDVQLAASFLAPLVPGIEAHGVFEWPVAMPLPDAIEALLATGEVDRADRVTKAFVEWGPLFDRPWVLALSGRCQALVLAAQGDLDGAEAAALRAVIAHELLAMPFELARTLLVLGQVQRRCGHRKDALGSLQRALALFEGMGAPVWVERATAEIKRIGVRKAKTELTENETRVAELAAAGLPNRQIAVRLFISQRTVEANLARAYRKLGVDSRAQLGALFSNQNPT